MFGPLGYRQLDQLGTIWWRIAKNVIVLARSLFHLILLTVLSPCCDAQTQLRVDATLETIKEVGFEVSVTCDVNSKEDGVFPPNMALVSITVSTKDRIADQIVIYIEEYQDSHCIFSARLSTSDPQRSDSDLLTVTGDVYISVAHLQHYRLRLHNNRGADRKSYIIPLSDLLRPFNK